MYHSEPPCMNKSLTRTRLLLVAARLVGGTLLGHLGCRCCWAGAVPYQIRRGVSGCWLFVALYCCLLSPFCQRCSCSPATPPARGRLWLGPHCAPTGLRLLLGCHPLGRT